MLVHFLKAWQPYFTEVMCGIKKFELRKDDRNFNIGDILILKEYQQETQTLTGRTCKDKVTYKLSGGNFGIEKGYCALGVELIKRGSAIIKGG